MNAPHFRTNPDAAHTFDAHAARGRPDLAVRSALTAGLAVRPDDIATPVTDTSATLPVAKRAAYGEEHALALAAERTGRQLIANQENVRRAQAGEASAMRTRERAAWVVARIGELEAAHHAELRAQWTTQAETEAAERYAATVSEVTHPATEAARPKTRRTA